MEENKTPKTNLTKNHKLDSTLFWKKTTIGLFIIIIFSQFFTVTITPKFNLPGSSQSQVVTDAVTGQVSSIDTAALASAVLPAEGVFQFQLSGGQARLCRAALFHSDADF